MIDYNTKVILSVLPSLHEWFKYKWKYLNLYFYNIRGEREGSNLRVKFNRKKISEFQWFNGGMGVGNWWDSPFINIYHRWYLLLSKHFYINHNHGTTRLPRYKIFQLRGRKVYRISHNEEEEKYFNVYNYKIKQENISL